MVINLTKNKERIINNFFLFVLIINCKCLILLILL